MDKLTSRGVTASRATRWLAPLLVGLGLLLVAPAVASADPGDVGYQGPSFQGASGSPSGSKPESKLWHHDGAWWGSLFDSATGRFYIWQLDRATQTWTRTATQLDERTNARADVLWDGAKLYVVTYRFSESDGTGESRLSRYSYNASTRTYSLDSGFPAIINSVRSETLVIAKDSTGKLWATWEQGGKIWINRSTTADDAWGTPFAMPGAVDVNGDDISSIIAFGGNRIGVMWSNQNASPGTDYFAVHHDGDPDTTWQPIESAYSGPDFADDHINLKTDSSGRVYAVVKTSMSSSDPSIVLLVRQTNGSWSNHTVSTGASPAPTRPIVQIDEVNSLLRVYYTAGSSGGTINEKTSPMSSISFPTGSGTIVIHDFDSADLNNVTSTKQNSTAQTGLVILATDDSTDYYWHADIPLGGGSDTTPPSLTGATVDGSSLVLSYDETLDSGSVPAASAFNVQVSGGARSVSSVGISGSAVTVTLGSPVVSTDTVTISYAVPASNPIQDVAGNDAAALTDQAVTNSTAAEPPPPGASQTFTPSDDAQVKSNSATRNYGSETTLRLREDPSTGTTYRSYVKFNVSGVSGATVTSVKLRLYVTTSSTNTAFVHAVSNSWSEGTITWNNAPDFGATALGSGVPSTAATWLEIELDPASISADGSYAFGLKSDGTSSAIFSSKEGSQPPQLIVTTSAP
ncbi:MAG: DNRLRE domain-containing protein [Chloroflexota bacterium]